MLAGDSQSEQRSHRLRPYARPVVNLLSTFLLSITFRFGWISASLGSQPPKFPAAHVKNEGFADQLTHAAPLPHHHLPHPFDHVRPQRAGMSRDQPTDVRQRFH